MQAILNQITEARKILATGDFEAARAAIIRAEDMAAEAKQARFLGSDIQAVRSDVARASQRLKPLLPRLG